MNESEERKGFDSAVYSREKDHLNRWPLAMEIYNIAAACPDDWSVRIGIYGEWGTGKTSILNFICCKAKSERQIVLWFNPWQYETKESLWRAFILALYGELKTKLGRLKAKNLKKRDLLAKHISWIAEITKVINEPAGNAIGKGIELLKAKVGVNKNDLQEVRSLLGGKRILVLIDDLDA